MADSVVTSIVGSIVEPICVPLVGRGGATFLPIVSVAPSLVLGARKMVQAYAGSCVNVVRASDSAAQDVGFNASNVVNMAAVATFAGASEPTVAKWYNQDGSGNDPANATVANQPRLRSANAWRGLQGLTFDGFIAPSGGTQIAKTLTIPSAIGLDRRASTMFVVAAPRVSYNANGIVEIGTAVTRGLLFTNVATAGNLLHLGSGATPTTLIGTKFPRTNPGISGWRLNASASAIFTDTTTDTGPLATAGTITGGLIGGSVSAGFSLRGEVYAVVYYPGILSDTEVAAVKAALTSIYGVSYGQTASLVIEGDSISEGTADTFLFNNLRQTLPLLTQDVHAYNLAVHGTTTAVEYPRRVAKFAGVARSGLSKNVTVFGLGSNDIAVGTTATTLWTTLVLPYIQYLTGIGYTVIVGTAIPKTAFTTAQETERLAYNQLLRDNAATNGFTVCDYCSLPEFDAQADAANTTYYYTDGVHPTTAGYGKMAALLAPLINAAIA